MCIGGINEKNYFHGLVITWKNEMVPLLFVILSCAAYHWKDIERLLNARRKIAGEPPIELGKIMNKVKAVNDYSIIIQEYFQARVADFLENYAKKCSGFNTTTTGLNFTKVADRFMCTF
jgi:hypothetical protein